MGKKRCFRKASKGEREVERILNEHKIDFVKEKTFDSCRSNKGYPLRFDFYLNAYNILIEYNGEHHYKPINKYKKAQITHNKTVINDKIKDEFADNTNIPLIKIPYWEYNKIRDYIEKAIGVG